ncbi:unnamed protein product [Acanthoscelides obtectus]|uniref:Uncharacterized protein n=1 Tax=Acanthoscelides obtectus TaxID=200917 RepID=A0A9P0MBD7_ACAOB|nr:unnamed protein product [Acanthoscelides obtectus]CAK1656037.1 hypothetical protein AOBTE_LOCUS19533 [Acanthoscelides obtectus]
MGYRGATGERGNATRTLAGEHVCMQHAHILAPPTRSAGWYLRV